MSESQFEDKSEAPATPELTRSESGVVTASSTPISRLSKPFPGVCRAPKRRSH